MHASCLASYVVIVLFAFFKENGLSANLGHSSFVLQIHEHEKKKIKSRMW